MRAFPDAARIVLKALYVARIGRMDFRWAVNMLAREVTRWAAAAACDRRLSRLVSFMYHTKEDVQVCYIGDSPDKCSIVMFCNASFAGDLNDSKSMSGVCLVAPNTFVVLLWLGKKQLAVSRLLQRQRLFLWMLDAGWKPCQHCVCGIRY